MDMNRNFKMKSVTLMLVIAGGMFIAAFILRQWGWKPCFFESSLLQR